MRLALVALVLGLAACDNSTAVNQAPPWASDAKSDADAVDWTYDHDCGKTCSGSGKCGYLPKTDKCIAVSQADCWKSNSCQVWTGTKPGQYNTCCLRDDIPSCGHCELGTDAWNGIDSLAGID